MSGIGELTRELSFVTGVLARRPFQLLLQVTNRCNMTCDFCDFWPNGVPPAQELSLEDYRRLETQLSGLGRFLISIEGGEPTLRPDLVELVRVLGRRHIPLLYTNGSRVDKAMAEALFGAGLAQVGVSIDYADAARHDARRGLEGAFDKAWRAAALLRDAAPHGGRQVHIMTVLMEENEADLEPLLKLSAAAGVGHSVTLVAKGGFRRGEGAKHPREKLSRRLVDLWERYPHFMIFRNYLEKVDDFLFGGELPQCRAGVQSFNIDHVGDVSPCIEKIDTPAGNVRKEPLDVIVARMAGRADVKTCQDCWTACRGFSQALGQGGSLPVWREMSGRMRSR